VPATVEASASLRPVVGSPREVEGLLRAWVAEPDPQPVIVRTSGSTGAPKDVVVSATALTASARATLRRLGGPGSWLLALPVQYVAGLQVVVRSVLAGTSPVVLADHPDLATATAALEGPRRYLSIVPTQLFRWVASPPDLEALRRYDVVLVGGAAADPGLLERARAVGVAVVTTYGMSETCGGCVYDGIPLDGVRVDVDGDGRIRLGGPILFDGYEGDPAATAEVLHDGWLRTSDIGRLDLAGRLEVLGRTDDTVTSGGVSVAMPAVERRLASMSGVAECAVVAVPDPEWGSRLVAYAVPADSSTRLDLAVAREFVAQEYPRSWAPRELVVTARLPMTDSGKVDRRALAALATVEAPAALGPSTDPDLLNAQGSEDGVAEATRSSDRSSRPPTDLSPPSGA
jgi:O-succinylbenzoic acid--CoA ligase